MAMEEDKLHAKLKRIMLCASQAVTCHRCHSVFTNRRLQSKIPMMGVSLNSLVIFYSNYEMFTRS